MLINAPLPSCVRLALAFNANKWITFTVSVGRDPSPETDFRPISVGAKILRAFHRCLARRWARLPEVVDRFQFAGRPEDGTLMASSVLTTLLSTHAKNMQPLAVALLDISKPFDSVSVHTILRAARSIGAPEHLVRHLHFVYSASTVILPNSAVGFEM